MNITHVYAAKRLLNELVCINAHASDKSFFKGVSDETASAMRWHLREFQAAYEAFLRESPSTKATMFAEDVENKRGQR